MSIAPTAAAPLATPAAAPDIAGSGGGFAALLSELNPLQYLPVIGTIYRMVTGEHIDPGWRLGGAVVVGALTGGPVGIVTSLIGVGLEELFHHATDEAPATAPPDPAARQAGLAAYAASAAMVGPQDGGGSG